MKCYKCEKETKKPNLVFKFADEEMVRLCPKCAIKVIVFDIRQGVHEKIFTPRKKYAYLKLFFDNLSEEEKNEMKIYLTNLNGSKNLKRVIKKL